MIQRKIWMSSQTLPLLAWNFLVLATKEDWDSQLHGCYLLFPCQLQAWLAPPYSQKQITILTMFQHVCFSFGLRAIVWIQHFQGGLHSKHYLHTIGKFRVIPWSKIKTVRTFVSFTEMFTGSFRWVAGLQKKIAHITPLFQSQVLVFQLIV